MNRALTGEASVLILDTCVLLDIIRSPVRRQVARSHAEAIMEILNSLRAGNPRCRLVVPPVVREEFERNLSRVVEDTCVELERVFAEQAHAETTLDVLLEREPSAPLAAAVERWVGQCKALACEILERAFVEPTNADDHQRAFARSIGRRAPAKQGKDSVGDCLVTEFSLRLAKGFSTSGQCEAIALVSSNTADYCEGRRLVPALQTEFDEAGLQYCRNWVEARRSVRLA